MTLETSSTLLLLSLLGAACAWDLTSRRIPNGLIATALVAALACAALAGRSANALVGAFAGLLVLLPFFAMRWVGAGDAKLLAAIGAFTGAPAVLHVLFYSALVGGALGAAMIAAQRFRQPTVTTSGPQIGERLPPSVGAADSTERIPDAAAGGTVPYAVALAAGTILHLVGARA
jgi:prepilin peptidase CpaA